MPKFFVEMGFAGNHEYIIEAEDEETACDIAEGLLLDRLPDCAPDIEILSVNKAPESARTDNVDNYFGGR